MYNKFLLMIIFLFLSNNVLAFTEEVEDDLFIDLVIGIILCLLIIIYLIRAFLYKIDPFHRQFSTILMTYIKNHDLDIESYYYYDIENNKETFGKNMTSIFDKNNIKKFSDLALISSKSDYDLLNQLHSILETKVKYLRNNINNENDPLNLLFDDKYLTQQITIYLVKHLAICFRCTGQIIVNSNNNVKGFIIWFKDLSLYNEEVANLMTKNIELNHLVDKYNLILDNLRFPIWMRGKNLEINYINNFYKNIMTQGTKKIFSNKITELDKTIPKLISAAKHNNETVVLDKHIILDGNRFLYEITEIPIADGKSIGFAYDATVKEKLQKDIQNHLTSLTEFLNSTANPTLILGTDMRVQFFNRSYVNLWGFEEKWLLNKPLYNDILEYLRKNRKIPEHVDFQQYKKNRIQYFRELRETHNEFVYLPDGRSFRLIVIPQAAGGLLFTYEDMTDKLQLERSLNTLQSVQKATLDSLLESVAVFSEDGRIRLYNNLYKNLWGLTTEYLDTKPHISDLIEKSKDQYVYQEGMWKEFKEVLILTIAARQEREYKLPLRNGKILERISKPLPDGGALISFIDITDSVNVEKFLTERNDALREADRIKNDYIQHLSVELLSPVNSIINNAESIRNISLNQENEYLENILHSSKYLVSILNDISDLSSIESGDTMLSISRFNIISSITSINDLISDRVKKFDIYFNLRYEKNIPQIIGDKKRIQQAIFKILSRLVDIVGKKGSIVLSISCNKENVIMNFKAMQNLIPEINKIDIAMPQYFVHIKKEIKTCSSLGISVARNFIELHGGIIEMIEEGDNITSITCYIPKNNPKLESMIKHKEFQYEQENA